jgi:hypothetical protein
MTLHPVDSVAAATVSVALIRDFQPADGVVISRPGEPVQIAFRQWHYETTLSVRWGVSAGEIEGERPFGEALDVSEQRGFAATQQDVDDFPYPNIAAAAYSSTIYLAMQSNFDIYVRG